MRTGFPVFRLAPEPWIAMSVPYDPDWSKNVFGTAVTVKAWDGQSKSWWFPRPYEPIVAQLIRENKNFAIPDKAIDDARLAIYRDKVHLGGESLASDYAILSLHPSAPPQLIEWALAYWKNVFAYYGAPTTKLLEVEEAFGRIMARLATPASMPLAPGQPRGNQG